MISLFIPGLVYARLLCSVTQTCNDTDVFHLSDYTNAHAELNNQSNYDYIVCCRETIGTTLGTGGGLGSAVLLHLSNLFH